MYPSPFTHQIKGKERERVDGIEQLFSLGESWACFVISLSRGHSLLATQI